ncbi:GNAT family N-acetyltransferase [Streptomyces sp. NPDC086023]|uniref:GNAT family N-acetyltransferase n=1 Tax=Streptomyces sp. NPDC086023 TaxID=3365746 RepID=UPI0037D417DD
MELEFTDAEPGSALLDGPVRTLYRNLRPALTDDSFTDFAREAAGQGLVFTVGLSGGEAVGVAGHRVLATSRGRVLFVDDLVTGPALRGGGFGAALFGELERRARAAGCVRIELDSGVVNRGAHRFYHRQRMSVAAFHFAYELPAAG